MFFDEYFVVNISLASNSPRQHAIAPYRVASYQCWIFVISPKIATPSNTRSYDRAQQPGLEIINSQFKSNLHGLGPGRNNRFSFSHNYFIWPNAPPAWLLPPPGLPRPGTRPLAWTRAKLEAYYGESLVCVQHFA